MKILDRETIERSLVFGEVIPVMREALIAQSHGECDTPMPMHLAIAAENAEVHMKSSFRRGGKHFALKIASTFPNNPSRGLSTGNGMILLCSAETGEPLVLLADGGHLTDVRTAAVAAMVAKELKRQDTSLGILGAGIQARLQVQMHAQFLALREIWIWGRTPERAESCRRDLKVLLPAVDVRVADSPAQVVQKARLIVTATASREPLVFAGDLQPGTHVSAVGSDSPGKQELDPKILETAALVLVDSRAQCLRLGELQHSPATPVTEIGTFSESRAEFDRNGITVCDLTGLGVEDLYIAEYLLKGLHENRKV